MKPQKTNDRLQPVECPYQNTHSNNTSIENQRQAVKAALYALMSEVQHGHFD